MPTATLMVLLSILRPREEIGKAFSQARDSLVDAANKRAVVVASGASSKRVSKMAITTGCPSSFDGERGYPQVEAGYVAVTTKRHPLQHARGKYPEELMEAIGGLGRRSQQRRPERQKVPIELHSGFPTHHI